eukprot:CAMPEP_0182426620 /NCGR_PEP_ID=MMETSP1167-20130531/13136_1 /TAXON_ID=2988 /ORGANISM="Mallomonas Sp, Strain CCMP3275" /LENGTH=68 /DNA_ID=CAMNT_0024608199 /DNA_START=71 /DNA_END=273 /DNA_ORIENTATION=-
MRLNSSSWSPRREFFGLLPMLSILFRLDGCRPPPEDRKVGIADSPSSGVLGEADPLAVLIPLTAGELA